MKDETRLELAFYWRNLMCPITSKHAMRGTASIPASPRTLVKAHPAYFTNEQDEAISVGPLYERANVSYEMMLAES